MEFGRLSFGFGTKYRVYRFPHAETRANGCSETKHVQPNSGFAIRSVAVVASLCPLHYRSSRRCFVCRSLSGFVSLSPFHQLPVVHNTQYDVVDRLTGAAFRPPDDGDDDNNLDGERNRERQFGTLVIVLVLTN